MIVFGIQFNFFIVLPIPLKTCRSNVFFYKAKCARPKNRARLRDFPRPSALDRHLERNLSRPDIPFILFIYLFSVYLQLT